jgi:hypothetical protein
MGTMMHDNSVIGAILRRNGFKRKSIPNYCPECYDVIDFCEDNPVGTFVLGTGSHVVTVINGNYYDSWDCGKENVNFAYEINTDNYSPPDVAHQMFRYCCTAEPISDTETRIRIYDGNGKFAERKIPTELTAGYILCLKHSNYPCIEI